MKIFIVLLKPAKLCSERLLYYDTPIQYLTGLGIGVFAVSGCISGQSTAESKELFTYLALCYKACSLPLRNSSGQ